MLIVFSIAGANLRDPKPTGGFAVSSAGDKPDSPALYLERYVSGTSVRAVHSASAIPVGDGLRAFWYGGTREGARDVAIFSAQFDALRSEWESEQVVITRARTATGVGRYIRKLGNAVAVRDNERRLWLFYVSVSVGGWAGSAINAVISDDDGRTWSPPRRLVASPFLNLSTLVRGRPFLFADGSIGLPAYHEFIGKFGEILRLDAAGNVIDKRRLSDRREALQPVIVPRSPTEAIGFLRYSGPAPSATLMVKTRDGGNTWSRPEKLRLPNPNAAVDAEVTPNGGLLLVLNNSTRGRDDLSIAYSSDAGRNWRVLHAFEATEPGETDGEYSYPWITKTGDGSHFHLLYTWNRTHIKHVEFNDAWLESR